MATSREEVEGESWYDEDNSAIGEDRTRWGQADCLG